MSVTYADANVFGAFEGLRYGQTAGTVCAALFLVGLVAAVYRWSWENASAWVPAVRSPRRACAATAGVGSGAVALVYAVWWAMKDTPIIGSWYLWSPGMAKLLTFRYWAGPGSAWLLGNYLPTDLLGALPGQAVLLLLPVLLTVYRLARRPTPGLARAAVTGVVAGLVAVAAAAAETLWLRQLAGPTGMADQLTIAYYFLRVDLDTVTVVAAAAAFVVALRSRAYPGVLSVFAASVTAAMATLAGPFVIFSGICGPGHTFQCSTAPLVVTYANEYGVLGVRLFVSTFVAAVVSATLGLTARRAWTSRRGRPAHAVPPHVVRRSERVLATAAAVFVAVSLVAATVFNVV